MLLFQEAHPGSSNDCSPSQRKEIWKDLLLKQLPEEGGLGGVWVISGEGVRMHTMYTCTDVTHTVRCNAHKHARCDCPALAAIFIWDGAQRASVRPTIG